MQTTITEENFPIVVQTILQNNNELRKQAEDLINQFKTTSPDQFIALLINHLKQSQSPEIRSFCAIGIRKNLSAFSEKSYTNIWQTLQPQAQEFVKVQLIEGVQTETASNIRHLICDAISEIAGSLFNEEVNEQRKGIVAWPEILPTIFQFYMSGSPSLIEASLKIMTSLFTYAATDFLKHANELHKIFEESLQNPEDNIKVAGLEAFGSFISILEPKECKIFEDLIPLLINTTVGLVEKNEEGGDTALSVLSDIAEVESKFLKKNFEQLFRAMQRVTLMKNLSTPENTKQLAVEIIVLVGERIPRLIRENLTLLRELFELIFTRMIDIDSETSESWIRPPEGYNQDEDEEEEANVKFGMNSIDRLISAVGEKITLPILSQMVEQMLVQSSDWRVKYAALMALSQVGEYLDSVNDVEPIVNIILQLIGNQHPRIRYAAAHCIGQLSDDMEPKFQEHFHSKVLPILLNALDDQVPRVQSHVLAALTNFLEGSEQSYVLGILNPLLEKSFAILQNGISVCKENALSCISAASEAAKEAYVPYYHTSLEILYNTLKNYQAKEYKQLRGQCIECITLTSVAAGPENFKKYAKDIIESMIQIQQNYNEEIDPNPTYIFSGWHRICIILQTDFVPYLPTVVPSLFRMAQTIFEQAAKEDELDDEQDIAQSVKKVTGIQNNTEDDKKQNYNTSYTEDAQIAIEMITVFIDELKGHFIDYVESTAKLIIPMVNFQTNENIRKSAAKALPELIECVKLSNNPNKDGIVGEMARMFIKEVWAALNTEYDPDIIIDQVFAVKEIIDHSGRFLNQHEIEELATKILLSLKDSDERKVENENFKNEEDVEQEEIDVLEDDTNLEDDLHIAIAELCGTLFKTHKELTVLFAKIIYREILTKVLYPTASNMMHKFGIYLVDDMIDYLGIELIPDEWPYLSEALLRYAKDPFPSVRQAACYGIGILAVKSTNTFSVMADQCLSLLVDAINIQRTTETEKEYYHCRDNAIASLGKIIQAHPDKIDLYKVCEIWLYQLPLKHDKPEAITQHNLLKDIVLNKPELVLGTDAKNLPQILTVFGEVINTKYCDEQTKQGAKAFLLQISQNDQMKLALQNVLNVLSEKQKQTLEELFRSN